MTRDLLIFGMSFLARCWLVLTEYVYIYGCIICFMQRLTSMYALCENLFVVLRFIYPCVNDLALVSATDFDSDSVVSALCESKKRADS